MTRILSRNSTRLNYLNPLPFLGETVTDFDTQHARSLGRLCHYQLAAAGREATQAHKLGLKAGRNLDNIQELLAQVEGEDAR
jgi:hypothetical protein